MNRFIKHIINLFFHFAGENLVSKPTVQVQEATERQAAGWERRQRDVPFYDAASSDGRSGGAAERR